MTGKDAPSDSSRGRHPSQVHHNSKGDSGGGRAGGVADEIVKRPALSSGPDAAPVPRLGQGRVPNDASPLHSSEAGGAQ